MSDKPNCACLEIAYSPDDIEFTNPVTGAPIPGKREKWLCTQCGCEYSKTLWHNAVNKQQQDEIERLTALLEQSPQRLVEMIRGLTSAWGDYITSPEEHQVSLQIYMQHLVNSAEEHTQNMPSIDPVPSQDSDK